MFDLLRTLFGIRQKRRSLPATPRPQVGASIVRNGFKIKVSQPCDPDLWDWLLLAGWRVNPVRHDRRRTINLPHDALARLNAAGIERRAKVHDDLLRATSRGRT